MKKKRILIIFPNEWLAYTPTILNLVKNFADTFDVTVIAIDDGNYKNDEIPDDAIKFIKINPLLLKLNTFTGKLLGSLKLYQLTKLGAIFLAALPYKGKVDEVIAADSAGLWVGQKIFGQCHFLSLELFRDTLFKKCDLSKIKSVIIQTQERYDYLFGKQYIKTFLLQNAPSYSSNESIKRAEKPVAQAKKAIFLGNANQRNGAYFCIEAIRELKDITLTIKGTISSEDRKRIEFLYGDLLANEKVIIDDRYVKQDEILEYLSEYHVGFCFYDLTCTDEITRFNFISVPSGKLFNYYAAGVPVIGSDLPGLSSVRDFETGVLLTDLSTENIVKALKYIDFNHSKIRENCFKAAAHFDFNSAVEPLKKHLISC